MKHTTMLLVAALCFLLSSVAAQPHLSVNLKTGAVTPSTLPAGLSWVTAVASAPTNTVCDRRGVLNATFDTTSRRRLEIDLEYDVPLDWTVNIGDSASNDGWGGDSYPAQSNDAEVHVTGSSILFYSRDHPTNYWPLLRQAASFVSTGSRVIINVSDGKVTADNGLQSILVQTFRTFALSGQADYQGPVNYDIYIGFNGVISARPDRVGTGLCGAYLTWHSQP